jgi:hypothetical protein
MLVAQGDSPKDALESVAALDRSAVRSIEGLFKVVYRPATGAGLLASRTVLQRILRLLCNKLEVQAPSDAQA